MVDPVDHFLYIATSDTGGPYDGGKGDVWKYNTTTGAWTQISPIPSSSADDYFGYSGLTIDRQNPNTIMVATQISLVAGRHLLPQHRRRRHLDPDLGLGPATRTAPSATRWTSPPCRG